MIYCSGCQNDNIELVTNNICMKCGRIIQPKKIYSIMANIMIILFFVAPVTGLFSFMIVFGIIFQSNSLMYGSLISLLIAFICYIVSFIFSAILTFKKSKDCKTVGKVFFILYSLYTLFFIIMSILI